MVKRDQPQSLTNLPASPSEERHSRAVRYTVTMSVRTICLIACILSRDNLVLVAIFGLGAIVLPYVAVVFANVGAKPVRQTSIVRPMQVVPVLEQRRDPTSGQ